jgi:hypothetical protein
MFLANLTTAWHFILLEANLRSMGNGRGFFGRLLVGCGGLCCDMGNAASERPLLLRSGVGLAENGGPTVPFVDRR